MLLDTLQTNTTIVSKILCVEGQKLWRWYRDSLSGFWDDDTQKQHHQNDIEVDRGKGKETIRVPILKPENIGHRMAVDEKQIGEDMHTILSNRDTGKIAMLARTVTANDLQKAIASIGDRADHVETMTRDMSSTYAKFCDEAFPNASQIAENINSRIQRFIMINQGTRDREFFYFRVANYFS